MKDQIKIYTDKVENLLEENYGITLDDISFNEEKAMQLIAEAESPEGYVEWIGEKYDLHNIKS